MSKLPNKLLDESLNLGCGLHIKIGDAVKILKCSRTTIYRWHKDGIDNHAAKELLKLHAAKRILPNTGGWRGFHINDKKELMTPLGDPLSARYLEQFRWFLSAWDTNLNVIKEINGSLSQIRDVADTDKGALIRKYVRLKDLYSKKTSKLSGRLAMARKKVKILENIIYVPSYEERNPPPLPHLKLVKPN